HSVTSRNIEAYSFEDRPISVISKMHIFEANRTCIDLKIGRIWLISDLLFDIKKVEHLLNIGQSLPDFTIDKSDEIERDRKLHQKSIDKNEVAQRLCAFLHFQRRHHTDNGHADNENHCVPKVEPTKRSPSLGRGFFISRHGAVKALGLHCFIAEIFDDFEIKQLVDSLGVGLCIGIIHFM